MQHGEMLALFAATLLKDTVWLSSLDLTKASQGWGTPTADRSVEGHPLTLRGQVFAHGFGTHSPGRLTVSLANAAQSFHAVVGIDDEVPVGRGSAEFEVIAPTGSILWRSGVLRRGDQPKRLDLYIGGLDRITLVVTTGGDGFDYDHADWADARFEYTSFPPRTVSWQTHTLLINTDRPQHAPELNGPRTLAAFPGAPFLWRVPATGLAPLTFSAKALPKGLALDRNTGILSGSAPSAGSYRFPIQVRNTQGVLQSEKVTVASGPRLALTPPMGWNSYDGFGDSVTEAEIMANADYVAKNLQPYGWDTVVVDYRWYDPGAHDNNANGRAGVALTMDKFGRLLPSPNRFPSARDGRGFRSLADRVHAMGLRFGIHIMRGIPRQAVAAQCPVEGSDFNATAAGDTKDICGWCADMYGVRGATPAGQAYYDSIFRLYASWGVDFVKMDDTSAPYHADEIAAVHSAILKCGRSIVYSLSPGETPIADAKHVAEHANMWRVSGDFWDNWGSLDHEFDLAKRWQGVGGPGHWPDADMLPLGRLSVGGRSVGPDRRAGLTTNEQITLLSLWCLLPSPLMLGGNTPDLDAWTLSLLTNPEVLALDQDPLAEPAHLYSERDGVEVWTRLLADGAKAIGIFNRGDVDVLVPCPKLALRYNQARNLWLRLSIPIHPVDKFLVPAHGAILLRLNPPRP